jgi:predicted membrane protein
MRGPIWRSGRKWIESCEEISESAVGLLNPNLAGYEAAMNVSPIYAGMYRMKLSLWGFQWNRGQPRIMP